MKNNNFVNDVVVHVVAEKWEQHIVKAIANTKHANGSYNMRPRSVADLEFCKFPSLPSSLPFSRHILLPVIQPPRSISLLPFRLLLFLFPFLMLLG